MINKKLAQLFAQNFIDSLEDPTQINLEIERNAIFKRVTDLIKEFPFLAKLDIENLTFDEIMEIVFEHIDCCNQYSIFDDPDFIELHIKLNKNSSFTSFIEMYLIMCILHMNNKKSVVFVFDNGNLIHNKNIADSDAFRLITDNCVHQYNLETLQHKFIVSVETALIQSKPKLDLDSTIARLNCKLKKQSTTLDILNNSIGGKVHLYPNAHKRIVNIMKKIMKFNNLDYNIIMKNSIIQVNKPNHLK